MIHVVMVVSCLELPNKGRKEKKDIVGATCLRDGSGTVKVSVDDQKEIWKEHMEKMINVGNGWSDSIDTS